MRAGFAAALFVAVVVPQACGAPPPAASSTATPTTGATTVPTATLCPSSAVPSARIAAAAAFDAQRAEVVMFGGEGAGASLADTWVRQSGCWSNPQPVLAPPDRAHAVMAYEPAMQGVVLYGGQHEVAGKSPASLDDTWTWDGNSWTQVMGPHPSLIVSVGAFDNARGELMVFGWVIGGHPQTWIFQRNQWTQLHPQSSPSARDEAAMGYDFATQRVVLYGGFSADTGTLSDTWTWDGTNWTRQQSAHSPGPKMGASICSTDKTIVLYGGSDIQKPPTSELWQWTGSDWINLGQNSKPGARSDATCVSDTDGHAILIGGRDDAGRIHGDLWTWDGVQWAS